MGDYSQYSDQEVFLLLEKDDKHAFTAIYERYERSSSTLPLRVRSLAMRLQIWQYDAPN
jgi:hypothetical protein